MTNPYIELFVTTCFYILFTGVRPDIIRHASTTTSKVRQYDHIGHDLQWGNLNGMLRIAYNYLVMITIGMSLCYY